MGYDIFNSELEYSLQTTITPELKATFGVGIDVVLAAEVYGSAKLPITFSLIDSSGEAVNSVDLTGELGISVDFMGLTGTKPFAYNTWHLYTSTPKARTISSTTSNNENYLSSLFDISTYSAEDLSYITGDETRNINAFGAHGIESVSNNDFSALIDNAYSSAAPTIAANSVDTVMAYVDVDKSKSENAATEIMYSAYDSENNMWYSPKFVDYDNYAKYDPQLITVNDEIYVIYQKRTSTKTLSEMSTSEYLSNVELSVHKFNSLTKEFENIGSVSYGNSYITSPQLCN